MENSHADFAEARDFCRQVMDILDRYKLFEEEEFNHCICGVAAGTAVDAHGDRMTREALESLRSQVRETTVWSSAEHNPLVQPVGRLIEAEIFYDSEEDEHVLVAVLGCYDPSKLPAFSDVGVQTDDLPDPQLSLPDRLQAPLAQLGYSRQEISASVVEEALDVAPELVAGEPDQRVRKFGEPITGILEVVVPFWLLHCVASPFLRSFSERFGEAAAEKVLDWFGWLKGDAADAAQELEAEHRLFRITSEYSACRLEFLIPLKDSTDFEEAINSLSEGARMAAGVIDQLSHLNPERLTVVYDPEASAWAPKHAATNSAGVIAEEPLEVDFDQFGGLSFDASVELSHLEEPGNADTE